MGCVQSSPQALLLVWLAALDEEEQPPPNEVEAMLESLDASFDFVAPAYVLVYRAVPNHAGDSTQKFLSCIRAEVEEKFFQKIFGMDQEFARVSTVLVGADGVERKEILDLPGSCIFSEPPTAEMAKDVVFREKTIFTHFTPELHTERGVHLLYEKTLLKIRTHYKFYGDAPMIDSPGIKRVQNFESRKVAMKRDEQQEEIQNMLRHASSQYHNPSFRLDRDQETESQISSTSTDRSRNAAEVFGTSDQLSSRSRFSDKYRVRPMKAYSPAGMMENLSLREAPRIKYCDANTLTSNRTNCHVLRGINISPSNLSSPTSSESESNLNEQGRDFVSLPVETDSGRKFAMEVDPSESIWRLKQKICLARGYQPEMQRLVHNGVILDDNLMVGDCEITAQSTLVLCLALEDGGTMSIPLS